MPPHNRARHIYADMWRATYPFVGDLYVFRGKRGDLLKILWHDGLGMSLYAKRLERGKFIWPSPADGAVPISPAQLGYMLEG
ncbi:MAG: IS66 family insertion sequence element accessory protein TnpB, partial [Acetobacteraceae bacterium]